MYDCILITGGAGFVGATLAIALTRQFPDTRVIALDNLHRRGSELNLPRLARAGVRFVHGDIRVPEDLLALLPEHPGLLIECSAEPSAQAGYGGSPEYVIRTNLLGCFHCLELARQAGADVIFMSTSRVYPFEALNQLPVVEEETRFALAAAQTVPGVSAAGISEAFPLAGARSLYGMTKLAAELMIEEYADAYGLRYIINRYSGGCYNVGGGLANSLSRRETTGCAPAQPHPLSPGASGQKSGSRTWASVHGHATGEVARGILVCSAASGRALL